MTRIVRTAAAAALACAALLTIAAAPGTAAEQIFVTTGTGGVTGVYYPAGGAVCRLVNKGRKEHGIRCVVESTDGSIFNVKALKEGELQFAVVQSDVQFKAFKGLDGFEAAGPDESLRSVFSLHSELFTVVARADAGIARFEDLKGKRVNLGNPGSGQRSTMEAVMAALGWTTTDFSETMETSSVDQSEALCENKFDAMVFIAGHPNGSIKEATTSCDAVLVPVAGAEIDKLVADNLYYGKAAIPGGLYRGNDGDVPTFGLRATFLTSAAVPVEQVYIVVKSVFDSLDEFKKLHPALSGLEAQEMTEVGLTAPLHDGALKYYMERGWK